MTPRDALVEACRALVDRGLVVRTWGNASVRLDDGSMLISPSGLPYESLGPDDFARVSLEDGSWTGPYKPSSEKGLHAAVYRIRPDVGAIVHTHQPFASGLAATGIPSFRVASQAARYISDTVPCADYALPTTRALARAAARAAAGSGVKAVLLANHGTVCLGENLPAALETASALERFARCWLLDRFRSLTGDAGADEAAILGAFRGGWKAKGGAA